MDGLGGEILMAWKGDDESKDVEIKSIDMSVDDTHNFKSMITSMSFICNLHTNTFWFS
jgi:hypothetical protein